MWLELARHGAEHIAAGHLAVGPSMEASSGGGWVSGVVHGLPGQAIAPGGPGDSPAQAPPGIGGKFTTLLGDVKWVALAAIILTFFAGIAVFTAGRVADHRHGASNGTKLMIAAAAGAVLYAIGYGVITGLAGP